MARATDKTGPYPTGQAPTAADPEPRPKGQNEYDPIDDPSRPEYVGPTNDAPKAQKEDTVSTSTESKPKAAPKPLTKAQVKERQEAGQPVFTTRDGKAFADRMARRAYRAAAKDA